MTGCMLRNPLSGKVGLIIHSYFVNIALGLAHAILAILASCLAVYFHIVSVGMVKYHIYYRIALNCGPGIYFFPVIFTPATKWDRCLLVEDSHMVYNLWFWWWILKVADDKQSIILHVWFCYSAIYPCYCMKPNIYTRPAIIWDNTVNIYYIYYISYKNTFGIKWHSHIK